MTLLLFMVLEVVIVVVLLRLPKRFYSRLDEWISPFPPIVFLKPGCMIDDAWTKYDQHKREQILKSFAVPASMLGPFHKDRDFTADIFKGKQ